MTTIKVQSDRPLYIDGSAVTEFETTEAHWKDLKRVHGDAVRAVKGADKDDDGADEAAAAAKKAAPKK